MDWQDKLADIRQMIAKKENILIAYSGGVDSSLLASVAGDVLKEKCSVLHTGLGDPSEERALPCRRTGSIFRPQLRSQEMLSSFPCRDS